jgi:hypothetical protein
LRKPPARDQAEALAVLGEAVLGEADQAEVGGAVVEAEEEEGLVEAALGVVASVEAVVVRAAEWEIPAAGTRSISAPRR